MGLMRVISISVLVAVVAIAVSCSGSGVSLNEQFQQWAAAQDFTTSLGTDASGLPTIPMDSGEPERGASTAAGDNVVVLGSDFLQKLNAEVDGTSLVMQAPPEGEGADPAIAYGLYKVSGLLNKRPTIMNFSCLPKLIDQPYYVGLADYTTGQWMWFGPIFTPEYELNLTEIRHQFVTHLGNMYFVLVSPPGCGATHHQTTIFFGAPEGDLPGAPHGLIASDGEFAEAVGLVWEPGARANHYEIWRHGPGEPNQDPAGIPEWVKIGQSEVTEFLDTTVVAGIVYGYKVRSVNAAGVSCWSNIDTGYAGDAPPPPPPPPNDPFVIEGGITWRGTDPATGGGPVPGVLVTLLGLQDRVAQETNADGRFRFANLPHGKYIVVPAAPDKVFDPWYRVLIVGPDNPVGHADFIACAEELACWRTWGFAYTFASTGQGTVAFQPLQCVVMTIAAGDMTYTVQTNADGYFEQTELPVGPYTVTPGKDGFTFTPEIADGYINGQQVQPPLYFVGNGGDPPPPPPPAAGVIEVHIGTGADPANPGEPVSAWVYLFGLQEVVKTMTDAQGNVRFGDLPLGTYIVMPYCPQHGFCPQYKRIELTAEHPGFGQYFRAFPTDNYHRVFGFLYSFGGEAPNHFLPLGGAHVTVTNPADGTTVETVETNLDGFYQAFELPVGTYVLTPSRDGYGFTPEHSDVTITGQSVPEPRSFLGSMNVP